MTWLLFTSAILSAAESASPMQDDAALNDVQWLGSRLAFAVGEHGALWKSVDSGQTWTFIPTPTTASLRSVSFLTDKIGFIAGTEYQPFVGLEHGVIYATEDGGQTWDRCGDKRLSGVKSLRFFTPDDGLAVCTPSPSAPTGIYRTQDSGQTWTPLSGPSSSNWSAAYLASPELGVLVAESGQVALIADAQILPSKLPPLGSRTVHGICLQNADSGWLVGDGGLVMHTATGGVVWQSPTSPLPDELRNICDFRSVDARGTGVWIVGAPGSVVWHSSDAGKSWTSQPTTDPSPLRKVRFITPQLGLAVGDFGRILRTEDGGQMWKTVRGGGRRLALLTVLSRVDRVPTELFGKIAGDQGFRAAAWVPTRSTIEQQGATSDGLSLALTSVGASNGTIDWRLPVDLPGLDHNGERLMSRWQERTEGRAPSVFLTSVVKQLRMWRPDVVIIDDAPDGNALAQYVQQALLAGVREAGDSTRHLDQIEFAALPTWKTPRVYLQLPAGSRGSVSVDPQEFLPRLRTTVQMTAAPARSLLGQSAPGTLSFRAIQPEDAAESGSRDFFQGLNVSPGTATRRALAAINEADLAADQQRVQKQRHFLALTTAALKDKGQTLQLAAQLPDVLRQAKKEEAIALLSDLAQSHAERSQWDSAEATYLELVRRYPEDPAALAAMRWLLQYWTSAEIAWQRQKSRGTSVTLQQNDIGALQNRVQQAGGESAFVAAPRGVRDIIPTNASGTVNRGALANRKGTNPQAPPDALTEWRKRAAGLAQQLEDQSPTLFERPEIQFPLAALRRARGSAGQADGVYRRFSTVSPDESTKLLAERELWLGQGTAEVPRHLTICKRAPARPHLDGVFSDACWHQAVELKIRDQSREEDDSEPSSLIMLAYDQQFLYIAASCIRVPGAPVTMPAPSDRQHDAPLEDQDRLAIAFDIDRDYATWYSLQVDQRGETHDQCWHDAGWDPQWYVASQADDDRWRVEIAIPWDELAPAAPMPRDAWAMSVMRIIPAHAVQSWTPQSHWPVQWDSFGLVRFE